MKSKEEPSQLFSIEGIVKELQKAQKMRVWYTKTRIMVENRLIATVAGRIGYSSHLEEKQRLALFSKAKKVIKSLYTTQEDSQAVAKEYKDIVMMVLKTNMFIEDLDKTIESIKKDIKELVIQLPIAKWIEDDDRRGIDLLTIGTILGEAGDLANYANPGKLWRRFGCAPYEHDGKMLMGSTWKSGREGKLPASCWEEFGYSPRRRSVMYIIGKNIMMLNKGKYRKRYDDKKQEAIDNHSDWTYCEKCKGTGLINGKKHALCRGTGKLTKRCDLHGMLLASKLFLKDLWIEWNKDSDVVKEYRNKYQMV